MASHALEGIHLSEEALSDLKLFEAGQLSEQEVLARALQRIRSKA